MYKKEYRQKISECWDVIGTEDFVKSEEELTHSDEDGVCLKLQTNFDEWQRSPVWQEYRSNCSSCR
jgi:hypothetical protein